MRYVFLRSDVSGHEKEAVFESGHVVAGWGWYRLGKAFTRLELEHLLKRGSRTKYAIAVDVIRARYDTIKHRCNSPDPEGVG